MSGTLLKLRFIALLALFCLAGCGNAQTGARMRAPATADMIASDRQPDALLPDGEKIAPVWQNLTARLIRDGLPASEVTRLFSSLPATATQSPMGRKISELYQKQFYPKPKGKTRQKYYKGVLTEANASLCRQYIDAHRQAFALAQKKYGVPPEIAAALLFVETRLGKVLADVPENAFYTLASMAVSTQPDTISEYLPKLKDYQRHLGWLDETMKKRAQWAYNETRALVRHMITDRVPPERLPSSIYGAVGLCQFMPSNISPYGADGDGDGRVDLFTPDDAIASLANYLAKHGWKPGLSAEGQHKALMAYNHSTVYANTIMALADLIKSGKMPAAAEQV